jgi:hypothetical protein
LATSGATDEDAAGNFFRKTPMVNLKLEKN